MRHILNRIFLIAFGILLLCKFSFAQSTSDLFMGDYVGKFINPPRGYLTTHLELVAQVYPVKNKYFIHILPKLYVRAEEYASTTGILSEQKVKMNDSAVQGEISDGILKGKMAYLGKWVQFELKKEELLSPTLGQKPTKEAIVLFDGSNYDHWIGDADLPVRWKIVNGDEMEVVPTLPQTKPKTSLYSMQKFSDMFLHLEFKVPLMADSTGQDRVNSGVIFENMFELQILDSYGLSGKWNDCGSIYTMSPPKVNMTAPPLQWQTYDIIYTAPKYNENGLRIKDAEITVYHNGKCIHYQYPIVRGPKNIEKGLSTFYTRISLQDHWNLLWFRNIWAIDMTKNPALPEYVEKLSR